MMKDTAPKELGVIVVAGLFGVIAAGVAIVLYHFGFIGGIFVGAIVAVLAAVVLALGWRAPQPGPHGVAKPAPAPAATALTEPAATVVTAPAPAPASAPTGGKPVFLDAARAGGPDDLKQIKGVGPKLETTLRDMGIYHFDQIAGWGAAEQQWMDDNLVGFKGRATRDGWVAQAKLLAAGEATAFSDKVKKGGVY
ncbi:NADH:ubiquinone oxidoreductase [Yoonia sp.]|uniref:NADH:ubiquinone oxidoreductase n=1 Tax=Yoonia sp. TaxID=2212373 RepID=UPI0025E2F6BC|nr:NADH:ubiquinone oxidoreductase [Yoonia sp.]